MAIGRLALTALLLLLAGIASAMPRILILQHRVTFRGADDPNLPIGNIVAAEFDELAKLEAIVWSQTDPILRAATASGKINFKDNPSADDLLVAAQALEADYILTSEAFRSGKTFKGKIEVLKNGKSIWKDEQNLAVTGATSSDVDSSLRSLARSLVLRMNSEVLKGIPSQKVATPELIKGQAPIEITPPPPPAQPAKKDSAPTLRSANELLAGGKSAAAISLLRDAIDTDPLDLPLRLALTDALLSIDPAAAALEARNAANLLPEAADLHVRAARAWMRAGRPEEAQLDLNEAMARNPDGAGTRLLLGEIGVAQLKPERSFEHLNKAIEAQDSAEGRFLRALTFALAGSSEGVKSDLEQLAKLDPTPAAPDLQRRYFFAADILDKTLQIDANAVRALVQRAVVKPNDKEVLATVELARKQVRSRAAFGELLGVPRPFASIHQQRLLAYKLMSQSLTDILGYMAGGGDDTLTDARIDLGEAIRNSNEARAAELKLRS